MKIPFLSNFRRGFATNSSSSHSFIYLKEPVEGHDERVAFEGDYHWNDFRADTKLEKLFYVLVSRIGGYWSTDNREAELERNWNELHEEFPELTREDFSNAMEGTVDHQSYGTITPEMARDPHVVLFGGNDNTDMPSVERSKAIVAGGIDWERTPVEYYDDESMSISNDPETVRMFHKFKDEGKF